jgi:Sulfotransferase family
VLRESFGRTKIVMATRRLLASNRLRAARAGRVGADFESRLIWMFGSPRSGSNWLLSLLAEDKSIVPINEPFIGHYLAPLMIDTPGIVPSDLDVESFTISRWHRDNEGASDFFRPEFTDVWMPLLRKLLLGRFFAHAVKHPAPARLSRTLVVIKEPVGSESADLIMQTLPRARLLFLLRDGRDVVDSELAANLRGSWISRDPAVRGIDQTERLAFAARSAFMWLWRTQVVQLAFDAHPGPKYLVRYEDLRRDPERELRALFDWLQIGPSQDELTNWIHRHSFERLPERTKGPTEFFRSAEPGRWRKSLTVEEQCAVDQIIGKKLHELGYET